MYDVHKLWDTLNNASVGALVGAFFAYILVAATDRRRNRLIAKRQLPALLRRLLVLVNSRLNGTGAALASVDRQPQLRNVGQRFPAERIDRYSEQVADRLTDRQASALDNLSFWMREADRLNAEALVRLDRIAEAGLDTTRGEGNAMLSTTGLKMLLKSQYAEEHQLLERIQLVIKGYLANRLSRRGGPLDTEQAGH
jgi:hypothetical protein